MKRLLVWLLAGCLMLTACTPRQHYEMRQDLGLYFNNIDEIVETIRAALVRRDFSITITCRSQRDHMEDLGAIVRDLMELALSETDSPQEGDYLRCQYGGCEMQYSSLPEDGVYRHTITILPNYYTTAEQEALVTQRVQEVLGELDLDADAGDAEKIYRVYTYVLAHTRYDEIHAKNPSHHLKSTAYAALIQGQAVCQGYASLLYRLLREAGVSVRVITGSAGKNGEFHAWNLVCIDGLYYHLDATWDDQSGNTNCFLRCDASFTDHQRDAQFADEAFYSQYPMALQDYDLEEIRT